MYPVKIVIIVKYFSDTMDIFSPYLRKTSTEVSITSPGTYISLIRVIFNFEASDFLQNYFNSEIILKIIQLLPKN